MKNGQLRPNSEHPTHDSRQSKVQVDLQTVPENLWSSPHRTFVVFSDDGCEERIRRSLDPLMPGIPGTKDEPFKKPGVDSGPSWPQKNQHQGGRLPAACTQRPSLEPTTLVERSLAHTHIRYSGWVHDSSNDPVLAGGLKRGRKKIAQDASEASLFTGRVVCANQESRRVLPSRVRLSSLDSHPKLSHHSRGKVSLAFVLLMDHRPANKLLLATIDEP
ncbi:hypothetical protein BDP67DRAFT_203191 [Colletotrichum lupini]|nr:hypothetical protein BDP67DRAFT_203191 [Colletotrichum lupini]